MNSTQTFNRMPRIREPLPQGEVKIPGPPSVSPLSKPGWFRLLLPLAGVFVMVGVYGGIRGEWALAVPMMAMSGVSAISSIVGTLMQGKQREEKIRADEAAYAEALTQKQIELEGLRQEQQRIRVDVSPPLDVLLARAHSRAPRLWERQPEDEDFLSVRLGIGNLESSVDVSAPHPDMPDPRLERAHAMEAEYAVVPDVPVQAYIRTGPLGIAGPLPDRTGVARALICNLVVHHSPDEVYLLAIYSPTQVAEWQWLKWLPHTYALGGNSEQRYLANDPSSARDVLKSLLEELHSRQNQLHVAQHGGATPKWPWLVLLVEDYALVRRDPAIDLLLSREGRQLNVTAIFMVDQVHQVPMGCSAIAESQANGYLQYQVAGVAGQTFFCWPDRADLSPSEDLARSLAPIQVYTLQSDTAMPTHVRLLDMMGIKDIDKYDVIHNWKDRSLGRYLKVPIGDRRGNQPMVLDLNHTGHGPHGLIAGTTGSGKSELVQTLVVALALTHHPYDVGFVLVDFKGGGTFSELKELPHTLGMVTDLSGNLTMRALVALEAEVDRRKQLFNDAGVNDIGPYQQLYWRGKVEKALPRLVVIIDEFAELVSDHPDFMDGLIAIARVGRSLGVHLILATQSPAGVVKQQIWANAKFRICLRVESRQESQEMLHRPEAANLPRMPGRGYLQVGNNDVFELFQVARVAGHYRKEGDTSPLPKEERIVIAEISPLGRRSRILFDSDKKEEKDDSNEDQKEEEKDNLPTDIDKVVEKLQNVAEQLEDFEALPSPWPDPLPEHVALPDLICQAGYAGWNGATWVFDRAALEPKVVRPRFCHDCGHSLRVEARHCGACGAQVLNRCPTCGARLRPDVKFCPSCSQAITTAASPAPASLPSPRLPTLNNRPWLGALLGLVDDPAHQRQFHMMLKMDQQDGQLIVVGAPGSGKEMWVRTFIMSLARMHAPDELHFYLLELGGQALKIFEKLPHVGGIFTPRDDERVPRLLRRLLDFLDERKNLCNQAGVDELVRLRELQPGQSPPAIVVVITGFMEFRTLFQDEMLQLTRLIREGGPYGIHIVLVGDRAGDVPMAISSVIARRVALRLADDSEYSIVLGMSLKLGKEQRVPYGRGWYGRPPLEFQTASPGYKGDNKARLAELQQIVDKMNTAWPEEAPSPETVRELPGKVPLGQLLSGIPAPLPPPQRPQLAVPLGLDGVRLRPVLVDLANDGPDFIVTSTPKGGKTTLLLTWALTLAEFNSPQQVQFVLISGRRSSLRPLEGLPHVLDHCQKPEGFSQGGVLARLQAEVQRREALLSEAPSHGVELSHIVVMFDDYDEFYNAVGKEQDVKSGLTRLAKQGRDVDIHTVVAGPLPNMGVDYSDPVVKQLKIGRSGFVLCILDASEQNPLGLRIRASQIKQMPPGRGYVVRKGSEEMLLQVAMPGNESEIIRRVTDLEQRWSDAGSPPASWPETDEEPEEKETAMA